jgi:transcriptional regulator with XRE-family HTH domain
MELLGMTEADLASRAAISRWRLRRHLTPSGFAKVAVRQLARYAEVFGVPVARLFEVLVPASDSIVVSDEATANRHVVITHISVKDP